MLQGSGEGKRFWKQIAKTEKIVEQIKQERGGLLPPSLAAYNPYRQEK